MTCDNLEENNLIDNQKKKNITKVFRERHRTDEKHIEEYHLLFVKERLSKLIYEEIKSIAFVYDSKSKRPQVSKKIISAGYTAFQNQLNTSKEQIGVRIDPNVTVDIHRIFRLPGSLNSKSGLAKILVNDIDKFDPYTQACFIDSDSVKVVANCPAQFLLKGKKFGPYDNETVYVPKFAAVYMICKGVANHA